MIFFDRSMTRPVARALQIVRDDVRWLEDEFPSNTRDVDWLRVVGERGWMVVMRDKRIRYRLHERQAMKENNVGGFIIGEKRDLSKWNLLRVVVTHLNEMEERFQILDRPFLQLIDQNGIFRPVSLG